MTIGERNFNIIRLHESGLTNNQIADMMMCSVSNVERVLCRYRREGDSIFENMKLVSEYKEKKKMSDIEKRAKELNVKIMPVEEPKDERLIGIRTNFFPSEFNRKLEVLKRTIKIGDSVRIGDGKTMIVEQKYSNLVYGHNRINPCWTCKNKNACEQECEKHKEYLYYRMPIAMTYVQLLEVGN